jgi:DNA-binding response OmpR family regulator
MLNTKKFQDARVLLFDTEPTNLRVTRAALFEIGFREIECIQEFKSFSKHVSHGDYDLIIAEVHNAGGGVAELMKKLRTGDIGVNPFVVTISTSWDRKSDHVRQLVDSGVDDLLLRPFSTRDLAARVHAAVTTRKGFIVTGDYVGPDRRAKSERKNDVELFHPPNTLKSSVEGELPQAVSNNEAIDEARQKMSRERIRTLAMRIVVAVELKINDPETGASINPEEIDGLARELRRRLRGRGAPDAIELATALVEITTESLEPEGETDQRLRLIRELALGAFTAYADGESLERTSGEVDRTVNVLREKLHEQSLRDWRRELTCAT